MTSFRSAIAILFAVYLVASTAWMLSVKLKIFKALGKFIPNAEIKAMAARGEPLAVELARRQRLFFIGAALISVPFLVAGMF